jgi:hypothetical protein
MQTNPRPRLIPDEAWQALCERELYWKDIQDEWITLSEVLVESTRKEGRRCKSNEILRSFGE